MYAGVDIGGTKTLVASLDNNGVITQKIRFETPKTYLAFIKQFKLAVQQLKVTDFVAGGVGAPGKIDRRDGSGIWFGNLSWKNVPLDHDIEQILECPIIVENDAKMAALSEAMMLKHTYNKVLYVTVSTGIGYGLVVNRTIDSAIGDGGGRKMLVEHHGKLVPWESFASGRAIVARYGKRAEDIHDQKTWRLIVKDLKPGLLQLIAIAEPEVIVIGGSVGTYFDRYGKLLTEELAAYKTPLVSLPDFCAAARPEEAVLFGCYDLAKATFSTPKPHTRRPGQKPTQKAAERTQA
jgi:predicted NBD/HSP70 family sugar kinase